MESICGVKCSECNFKKNNKCDGCKKTNGCPFGKKCFISDYISIGGKEKYELFKKQLIDEFNSLNIDGMPKINELYSLNGLFINLEYSLSNGTRIKLLDDDEIYLGNQIECLFNNNEMQKYFGLVANMNFLFVCQYEKDEKNPEIVIYKKR